MGSEATLPVVIVGAGGHARVLISVLRAQGASFTGCTALEPPPGEWPEDVPYLGRMEALDRLSPTACVLINGVGSAGPISARRQVFLEALKRGFSFRGLMDRSAIVAREAQIAPTALVMAGAIVQPGAWIGTNVLINTGAIVDHDCRIGDHSHIATGARLAGTVTTGPSVHVGAGATVIQQVHIGEGAVIGSGAVVIRTVAAGSVQAGVPARPLRQGAIE